MAATRAQGLTESDLAQYRALGWVTLSGVFADDRLDTLRASVDGAMEHVPNTAWEGPHRKQFEDGHQFSLQTRHGIHEKSPWREAVADPVLMSMMAGLLGADRVRVAQSTVIVKPPEHGQAFPPHQDSVYYGQDEVPMVVALVHLDDTTSENGPIRYLEGSHLAGELPHVKGSGKRHIAGLDVERMTEVCAKAGDVVCAHIHLVHGSLPNRSEASRRLVRVVYTPA